MSYRYHQPLSIFRELQNELLPLMGWNADAALVPEKAWAPKVDIKEETTEFIVFADIPGVDPKEIEIDMDGNTLTVKGERTTIKETKEKEKNYYRIERTSGKFYRQFTLPESVDASKITAKVKQGVLAIHLPKAIEGKHQRKITVVEED
ncbi:MAG: Hsp20/alpha crystallin family protein [Proteobacteria bacterium]|nr:Hsp20/alpha crystallin family protein [Pseudomonadota bacterium]